jgi:hypothetical protein
MGFHDVGQVSLAVTCQTASFAASEALNYVIQDISGRGHQCRRPDHKVF